VPTGQVEQAPLILKKPDAQTQVFVTLEKISLVEQVEIQVWLDEEYCVFTGQVEQAPLILKKPDAQTQVFVREST
jgi:hypothetical protein